MIAKLTTGNGFGGALRYDLRTGKGVAEEFIHALAVNGVRYDFDNEGRMVVNPKRAGIDFRLRTRAYAGKGVIRKPVYHWALSYSPKDNVSEEQMLRDAKEFLKRIGFDDTQYVMIAHHDKPHDHLHIVTNIVNNQGKRIPTMGLIDRAHEAAATITKERGYIWGKKIKEENITKERMHKPHERAKKVIESRVREALSASTSIIEFQTNLIDNGVFCNFTEAKDGKNGRISYADFYEDVLHTFKGSSLARDLSYGHINERLQDNALKQNIKLLQQSRSLVSVLQQAGNIFADMVKRADLDNFKNSDLKLMSKWNNLISLFFESKFQEIRQEVPALMDGGPSIIPIYLLSKASKAILLLSEEPSALLDPRELEDLIVETKRLQLKNELVFHEMKLDGTELIIDSDSYTQRSVNYLSSARDNLANHIAREQLLRVPKDKLKDIYYLTINIDTDIPDDVRTLLSVVDRLSPDELDMFGKEKRFLTSLALMARDSSAVIQVRLEEQSHLLAEMQTKYSQLLNSHKDLFMYVPYKVTNIRFSTPPYADGRPLDKCSGWIGLDADWGHVDSITIRNGEGKEMTFSGDQIDRENRLVFNKKDATVRYGIQTGKVEVFPHRDQSEKQAISHAQQHGLHRGMH